MSFRHRHPSAGLRHRTAPWSFWLWSGGAWLVLASAVFRGEGGAAGPGLATWGPGAGVGDALIASTDTAPGPPRIWSTPKLVPPRESAGDEARAAAQTAMLTDRSGHWHALGVDLRQLIDREAVQAHSWGRLMVIDSGEASGNATDVAFRSGATGTAGSPKHPHFVIGNGSRSEDGQIEPTGHPLREESLLLMLIGDLLTTPPTAAQLRSLTELIGYLRAKTGVIPVQSAWEPTASSATAGALPQAVLDLAFNRTLRPPAPSSTRAETE